MTELSSVHDLVGLLRTGAAVDDGEAVDLLAHSLQCVALLAERAPDDLDLQAAGLVHDVGTLLEPGRPATHARTGAIAVRGLLGARVATLVEGHDQAKRYLVATDAAYRSRLSDTSIMTLEHQGGAMRAEEITTFEGDDAFVSLVALRRADDDAKVRGAAVAPLDTWTGLLETVAGT